MLKIYISFDQDVEKLFLKLYLKILLFIILHHYFEFLNLIRVFRFLSHQNLNFRAPLEFIDHYCFNF